MTDRQIIPFSFEDQTVRAAEIDGEPWFVGRDVALALKYSNPQKAVRDHCKAARPIGVNETFTPSLDPQTVIIPERDVYRLIMRSNLPSAEKFEEMVVGEILPAIRRGQLGGPAQIDVRDPSQLTAIAIQLIEVNRELTHRAEAAEAEVLAAMPKTQFFDQFANADGLYTLQNAGRIINGRPNKFIQELKREHLFYQGSALVPRVQYRQAGLFEVKVDLIDDKARPQTFITPKGLQHFAKKFGEAPVGGAH